MKLNLESYCNITKVINNLDYANEMGIKVPAGAYFYKFVSNDFNQTGKIVYLK